MCLRKAPSFLPAQDGNCWPTTTSNAPSWGARAGCSKSIMTNDPIKGVYELGHALYLLDAEHHGFTRSDIERVECFWTFGDMDTSSAGFLLRLRDGRRAYLD